MKYVLGIDSGGTKYLVRAAGLDGGALGCFEGVPANHYLLSMEETRRRIGENIDRCLAAFGGRREDCVFILSGSAGCDSDEDAEILCALYRSLPGFCCPVVCVNDAQLAHYTVTSGVGILLVAGTGAIAFGRNAKGETRRVGGWPLSVMGEEGSGRYVDAWALHCYTRYMDGLRPRTPLIEGIESVIGVRTVKQMMDYTMELYGPPWQSPGLGRVVNEAALAGDAEAMALLERAAQWNVDLLGELVVPLGFDRETQFTVGIWGSTIIKGAYQRAVFERLLARRYPNSRLAVSDRDAAQGAVAWALEQLQDIKR